MLEANMMKVLRKIVGKKQRNKPINKRILRYPTINQWMERRRIREQDQHVARMDAERLLKTPRDIIHVGRRSPERPKRRWSDLTMD